MNKSLNKRFSTIAGYPNQKSLVNFLNENNHKFLGYISREMKSKLFLDNDCIIFTSPNEGSPLILLEAMASGVFILSSNVGFIPELLGKNIHLCVSQMLMIFLILFINISHYQKMKDMRLSLIKEKDI